MQETLNWHYDGAASKTVIPVTAAIRPATICRRRAHVRRWGCYGTAGRCSREFGTYGGQLEAAGAVPATDSLVDGPKADAGPGAAALAFVVDTAKRQRVVCGGWRSGRA
jgi:hypothetical protein